MSGVGVAPAAPLSSLVPSSESVFGFTVEGVGQICPKRPYVLEAVERPEMRFPASCDSYGCEVCGARKALQAAAVMTWAMRTADRSRLFTATLAPEDWQTRRQKVRNFARALRKSGYRWEMGWTTERGSKTGMVHIHGVQHGDKVPQPVLQETWGAIVDIRAVKQDRLAAAKYVTKEALRVAGYVVKGATAEASGLSAHLDLNGGRAAHWSRGFLHGRTKREALSEVRRELSNGEALTWRLIPAWSASGVLTTSPA